MFALIIAIYDMVYLLLYFNHTLEFNDSCSKGSIKSTKIKLASFLYCQYIPMCIYIYIYIVILSYV